MQFFFLTSESQKVTKPPEKLTYLIIFCCFPVRELLFFILTKIDKKQNPNKSSTITKTCLWKTNANAITDRFSSTL